LIGISQRPKLSHQAIMLPLLSESCSSCIEPNLSAAKPHRDSKSQTEPLALAGECPLQPSTRSLSILN
jgi:hypothetical protein